MHWVAVFFFCSVIYNDTLMRGILVTTSRVTSAIYLDTSPIEFIDFRAFKSRTARIWVVVITISQTDRGIASRECYADEVASANSRGGAFIITHTSFVNSGNRITSIIGADIALGTENTSSVITASIGGSFFGAN